ncbi:hypothetical protein AB0J52_22305 [Spirillospora sp. NPDC049652]
MRAARFKEVSARPSARVLLVLLALATALTGPAEIASAVVPAAPVSVETASPGCGDEDDGLAGHSDPSAVRPTSAEPGRPSGVRLLRTPARERVPAAARPVAVPRAATPVPAAGHDGRAPGTGLLVTLSVFRT